MMHKIQQGIGIEEKPKKKGQDSDLISLLTHDQLKDLTLLVTAATEVQRKWLLTSFEEAPKKSFKEKLGLGDGGSSTSSSDDEDGMHKDKGALKLPLRPVKPQEKAEQGQGPVLEDKEHQDAAKEGGTKEELRDKFHHLQMKYEEKKSEHEKHKEEKEKQKKEKEKQKETAKFAEAGRSTPDLKAGEKAELDKPKVNIKQKELEAAVVGSFDDWQQKTLARIAEVVNDRTRPAGTDAYIQAEAPENVSAAKKAEEHAVAQEEQAPQLPPRPKQVDDPRDVHNLLYPPIDTALKKSLSPAAKPMVIQSLLLLLLSLETYDARSRTLLRLCASSIGVKNSVLLQQEISVAQTLVKAARGMSGEAERKKAEEEGKWGRRLKIGLAGVAGAAVIGLTGGLAAPLLAAGIGTVMSGIGLGATAAAGYLGALAGSSALVGTLFGAYGAKMTGEMMERYAAQIKDFSFLPVKPRSKDENRLSVTIGISGWLTAKEEVLEPWRTLSENSEVYALRWEVDALMDLGSTLQSVLKSYAWAFVKKELIARTIFATLFAALWPIGLLKIARTIDNPFAIAQTRAMKAGRLLADALINKAQGERPVTLIGYSIGARVIYSCLQTLAERKAAGLVENVYIMGTPAPVSSAREWAAMRSVVSGRLVNVYSENDYILAFLYRASAAELGAAGLQPIEWPQAVENVDVSSDVEGHLRYRHLVGSILGKVGGSELVDWNIVGEEMELAELMRQEERKRDEEAEKEGGGKADAEVEKVVQKVEKEQQERKIEVLAKEQKEEKH